MQLAATRNVSVKALRNFLAWQARAFLGRRNAGSNREELQQTLQELHTNVFTQIDQEVCLLLRMCCR